MRRRRAGLTKIVLLMLVAVGAGCIIPPAPAAEAAEGQKTYGKLCSVCHGRDGRAQTPIGRKLGVKDLSMSKLGDQEIKLMITKGATDKDGKTTMPSFEDRLSAKELETLVEFVKGFRKTDPAP